MNTDDALLAAAKEAGLFPPDRPFIPRVTIPNEDDAALVAAALHVVITSGRLPSDDLLRAAELFRMLVVDHGEADDTDDNRKGHTHVISGSLSELFPILSTLLNLPKDV